MALKSIPEPLPVRSVTPLAFETPTFEKEKNEQVTVTHKNLTRKYTVFIEQEGVLNVHQNKARFSFTVKEEMISETLSHRTFENAAIEIYSDKKEIEAPISFDVARLIQTTKYEIAVDKNGERNIKLISSDPGKLRSVLRLIESSLALLATTLPKEAMTIGEKWKYQLPGESVKFNASRTLLGQTADRVVIRQTVNQFNPLKSVKTHVSGSGMSVINKADGGLEEGTLTLQTIAELKDRKHISSTRIVLKAAQ